MKFFLSRIASSARHLKSKQALALVVLFPLTLLAGIYLARFIDGSDLTMNPLAVNSVHAELSALRDQLKVAQDEIQMHRTRHEVNSRALEMVRAEMAAQKEQTADLEEGILFYRSLVVPEDSTSGLSLRKPELVPGESPGHFAYRIVVLQKARELETVEGSLLVEVFGYSGDEEVSYPLAELSREVGAGPVALRFRYFQAIEGELALPEGFVPKGMTLEVSASRPYEAQVREQFPWELQERLINVGQ